MKAAITPSPASLLGHGPEAVLLERIDSAGEGRLTASMTVRPDTPYSLQDGSLAAWAGPELMAQAISALANLEAGAQNAGAIGLLLGVRDYRAARAEFPIGARLLVEVIESTRDEDGRGVFDCRILQEDLVVAEGRLTVFRPADAWLILGEQAK